MTKTFTGASKGLVAKDQKRPIAVVEPSLVKRRQLQSLSASESEDEVIPLKNKTKSIHKPTLPKLPPPQAAPTAATNTTELVGVPAVHLSPQTTGLTPSPVPTSVLNTANNASNQYLQSILELQQMQHRHSMAQQQAQFMTILQQQQQAEADSSFRTAFLLANKL